MVMTRAARQASGMRSPRPLLLTLALAAAVAGSITTVAAGRADALSSAGSISFPGLGRSGTETMSGPVFNWGCRGGELGPQIYRWGCAGDRNRYLMGHAFAGFEELHNFVAARGVTAGTRALVGLPVHLRTATGRLVVFRVTWARVASVKYWGRTGDRWAWNETKLPSITFQTCYGARSEYRLIVRAERVD